VRLDGRLGDEERGADFGVAFAATICCSTSNSRAVSSGLVMRWASLAATSWGCAPGPVDGAHGFDELLDRPSFRRYALAPARRTAEDVLVAVVGGQDDDAGVRELVADAPMASTPPISACSGPSG
jgi:hypothetical protein